MKRRQQFCLPLFGYPAAYPITKKVAGVKALSIEETIATCCKLLEAKVKADAADLKEEEREAMPAYIEEYFTKQQGAAPEKQRNFLSLFFPRQQYRHAGGRRYESASF